MRFNQSIIYIILFLFSSASAGESIFIPSFLQEKQSVELKGQVVHSVVVTNDGEVYGGTDEGMSILNRKNNKWEEFWTVKEPGYFVNSNGKQVAVFTQPENNKDGLGWVYIIKNQILTHKIPLPKQIQMNVQSGDIFLSESRVYLAYSGKLFSFNIPDKQNKQSGLKEIEFPGSHINQIAIGEDNTLYIASGSGLYKKYNSKKVWEQIFPSSGDRSWALNDCRSVVIDSKNRLWFASPQGVGVYDGQWTLYEGKDGLPYNDFTKMAAGPDGDVWFGTHKGAIHFDGNSWEYRQGKRWLPDDDIHDVAVAKDGTVWFATSQGLSKIYKSEMTLAEKAEFYEDAIDKFHRRTPYEYVLDVSLSAPGDTSTWTQHDSDNDGLWTGMYGAAECFAYGATKDPKAKARAKKAFEALKFLGDVTQNAPISPPPGFVARTILPTSGPDPNDGRLENDQQTHDHYDKLWKVYEPRWPKSRDGKWYYKTDTSSDELDGHYFLYALYYDLVAETEAEKAEVREHVVRLTNHLINHDFQLVDHDGRPTRWARFNPDELNHSKNWFAERGLNSLSMLSYLAVAYHMTGNSKYRELSQWLNKEHGYAQNMIDMKFQRGVGTGNQSDDEMAMMAYYHLINYEWDPELKSRYAFSMYMNWMLLAPELNPFFNFTFRAATTGLNFSDAWGTYDLAPHKKWLEESVETLVRFPLDRFNWRHENSQRIDLLKLHSWNRTFDGDNSRKGYRVDGKVIPVDECFFNHWNRDPWTLNTGGNGQELADGTVFLLPYYMGLYYNFIRE
ncbi:MAG: hypothetical protein ACE5D0_01890 [Fidelibacterota bacterium]